MADLTINPVLAEAAPQQRDVRGPVQAARQRLDRIPSSTRSFGVIRMWPEQAVAEHENIARLREAAHLIGAEIVELDSFGRVFDESKNRIADEQVDFVLHLHFDTPKVYDAVSIAAMWNPLQFYFVWGFHRCWANQLSHDIFATTDCPQIEDLLRRERGVHDMPVLNHTIAGPIYVPRPKSTYKAFYCGINWERLGGQPGRHSDLLRALDSKGRLDLYGPDVLQGVRVWDGYAGYRGPLPFDGKAIVRKIWDAGACLVLSSDAHRASGIMSNRLFEALAGGAVVIADDHRFIPKAIGDNFIRIPSDIPSAARAELVLNALEDLERAPERAARMARATQDRLIDTYYLPTQLAGLFEAAHRFRAAREARAKAAAVSPAVDVIVQPLGLPEEDVLRFVQILTDQLGSDAHIVLVVPENDVASLRVRSAAAHVVGVAGNGKTILPPFDCLEAIRPQLRTKKAMFFLGIEEVFGNELIAACRRFTGRPIGRIGAVAKRRDDQGKELFDYLSPHESVEWIHPATIGTIVFDCERLAASPCMSGLTWHAVVQLAESKDDLVATSLTTALIVDTDRYEQQRTLGFDWAPATHDQAILISRLRSIVEISEDGAVVRRPTSSPPPATFMGLFNQLTPHDKLRVGLEIYKSLPTPPWVRRIVRLIRRGIGIR